MNLTLGLLMAVLPVAPFTSPLSLSIPNNIPSIEPGLYKRAIWLDLPGDNHDYKTSTYIGTPRRRGNIVSFYTIRRHIFKETSKTNRYSKRRGNGSFLPGYDIDVDRFNCQDDTYSSESALSIITAWGNIGETGGFQQPLNYREDTWTRIPGQVRVMIEGRPYWTMKPSMDPRHEEKPLKWISVRPGSIGASQLDYACTVLKIK